VPERPGAHTLERVDRRLVIFYPVVEGGRTFGTLFLRWDLRPWFAELRTYILGALVVLILCIVVAAVIGDVLQNSLSTAILQLAETANTISRDRNYSVRAAVPRVAELATLARAFNELLHRTHESQARLAAEAETTRRAQQQLRLIMDATPGLISYIDAEGRYHFANRQYQDWFGRPESEIVGMRMEDLLGGPAFERVKPYFDRARAGHATDFELEAPFRGGLSRWIHGHYIPHHDARNVVVGVVVLVLDISERRRMQASLAEAHAELERYSHTLERAVEERTARMREVIGELEAFSYSIAHDMRAPLRGMQGFSRLLLEEHAAQLNEEGQSFLKRIIASADRLDHLIQDVLNYSRMVREDLRLERVDAHTLITEIIASYPNLQPPNADVRLEGTIPPVWANPAALTQVVANLLGNAVKFVPPGVMPKVQVSAVLNASANGSDGHSGWVRLTVADNGIGIPKDAQHRLFAMFQRLHRPELYEGTGMGLAIVRKAVERMGGRLGVDSEPGRGSRFWVELRANESSA
jgi:PAS domain S-box-containing protein